MAISATLGFDFFRACQKNAKLMLSLGFLFFLTYLNTARDHSAFSNTVIVIHYFVWQ